MQTAHDSGGRPLEDRLRNLILKNVDKTPSSSPTDGPGPSSANEKRSMTGPDGASDSPTGVSRSQQSMGDENPKKRGNQKRLNQAQRRQMNAQLTIPIDPRAVEPPRSYASSSGFQSQRPSTDFHEKPGRDQTAVFRGGPQRYMPSNPPNHSHPFSQQQQQHQYQHHDRGGFGHRSLASPTQNQHRGWEKSQPHQGPPMKGINIVPADAFSSRPPRNNHGSLYNPGGHRQYVVTPEDLSLQSGLLEQLCATVVNGAEIQHEEIMEKENFRAHVEEICRAVVSRREVLVNGATDFPHESVKLNCFGSLSSGFATKAADMDLGLLSPLSMVPPDSPESPIPRVVEKALLNAGFGARLLTRTRVPIIKLCEKPTERLRLDLLQERTKWEQGLDDDDHDGVEDGAGVHDNGHEHANTPTDGNGESPSAAEHDKHNIPFEEPVGQTNTQRQFRLKQLENQSLAGYYGTAKRLLRRMNGSDILHSNATDFTVADFTLLNDFCQAFIEGLHDQVLSNRIKSYRSFSAGVPVPNFRSLYGMFMMVEGEKLVMLWENRKIPERDLSLEQSCAKIVTGWAELQKGLFEFDPLAFNKQLTMAVERLRQIPSIQLMQLRQDVYESPTEYYCRLIKMMTRLSETALTSPRPDKAPPTIQLYVSGIRQDGIREQVEQFVQSSGSQNLRVIARRHKSLHLAAEYAIAIEKGFYNEEHVPLLKQYIRFLRSDFIQAPPPYHSEYGLPIPEALVSLFDQVRKLPDPSRLAPNLPKDKYHDKLEFPKSGVGVQCDINFAAHLGFQNSLLLRCYSYTDPRVRPLVLFVKHWAKARGINTPYRGTLSSYGYVLMMLHYLINIAQPFVCPNLQELAPPDPDVSAEALEGIATCKGRNVRFWRDEQEIQRLARKDLLNQNKESVGSLLRGFFEYYANNNMMSTIPKRGFEWGRDILSIRTHGGIIAKQEKGWTGAKTVIQVHNGAPPTPTEIDMQGNFKSPGGVGADHQTTPDVQGELPLSPDGPPKTSDQASKPKEFKEVRHRYLFAIEDPFELEHNVARTVTHNGIVAIRDEFRRAWRIIKHAGKNAVQEDLLEDVKVCEERVERKQFADLLAEIHGLPIYPEPT